MSKRIILISLALIYAIGIYACAQREVKTGSPTKERTREKKIILPDSHGGPLPMRVIENH